MSGWPAAISRTSNDYQQAREAGEGRTADQPGQNLREPQLDFSQTAPDHDDLLVMPRIPDAALRHESGKSKGQFYTLPRSAGSSQGDWHLTREYEGPHRLRPDLRLGSVTLECRSYAGKTSPLKGRRKTSPLRVWPHEHILHDFPTANIVSGNTLAAPNSRSVSRLPPSDYVVGQSPRILDNLATGLSPRQTRPALRLGELQPSRAITPTCCISSRSMKIWARLRAFCPRWPASGRFDGTIESSFIRSGYLKGIIGYLRTSSTAPAPRCIVVLERKTLPLARGSS